MAGSAGQNQAECQARLARIHAQAGAVDVSQVESDQNEHHLSIFVELIGDALELLASLDDEEDGQIAGLRFATSIELQGLRRRLERARRTPDLADCAQLCELARGTIRRCMRVLVEALGGERPSPLHGAARNDLETALKIRQQYAALCSNILDPADSSMGALAAIRSLHERAVAWFAERDPQQGRRLHADLQSAAEILQLINQRQELRDHDRVALARALELARAAGPAPELIDALTPLAGLEATIDRAICRQRRRAVRRNEHAARRARRRPGVGFPVAGVRPPGERRQRAPTEL